MDFVGTDVAPSANFIHTIPFAYVAFKMFILALKLTQYRRPINIVIEYSYITCTLPRKDQCKITLQLIGVIRCYISSKSGFG